MHVERLPEKGPLAGRAWPKRREFTPELLVERPRKCGASRLAGPPPRKGAKERARNCASTEVVPRNFFSVLVMSTGADFYCPHV